MSDLVHIQEAWHSAGKKFGWVREYGSPGLGIRAALLAGSDSLRVRVGDSLRVYVIFKPLARELVARYGSEYIASGGVLLGVVPWKAFSREQEDKDA